MMNRELVICVMLLALVLLYFAAAQRRIARRRKRLGAVVLVNGTRGKSSTTRLIAAGLRASPELGPVLGKTTGTSARWLLPDGTETEIARPGPANIREMAEGLALAERIGATVYVAECMAIRAEYQKIIERSWMRADITVMTNVRADHEEHVGEGLKATALSLAAGLPETGVLVTYAEAASILQETGGFPSDRVVLADPGFGGEYRSLFPYPVVPENLSLALTVCSLLGVSPAAAAGSMAAAAPDPGNLELATVPLPGGRLIFVGAFAANDPESTLLLAERNPCPPGSLKGVWLHGRADRRERGKALCRALSALRPDFLLLSGDAAYLSTFWPAGKCRYGIFPLPLRDKGEVAEALARLPEGDVWLFGAGNAKGLKEQTVEGAVLCRNFSLA